MMTSPTTMQISPSTAGHCAISLSTNFWASSVATPSSRTASAVKVAPHCGHFKRLPRNSSFTFNCFPQPVQSTAMDMTFPFYAELTRIVRDVHQLELVAVLFGIRASADCQHAKADAGDGEA